MAWTKSSENGYLVATTTVTLSGNTTDKSTDTIDFIPSGKDFVVIANTAIKNLSAACTVDVDVALSRTGTFTEIKSGLISDIDNAEKAGFFDVSANGCAPYYQIRLNPGGVQKANDVVAIAVLVY